MLNKHNGRVTYSRIHMTLHAVAGRVALGETLLFVYTMGNVGSSQIVSDDSSKTHHVKRDKAKDGLECRSR